MNSKQDRTRFQKTGYFVFLWIIKPMVTLGLSFLYYGTYLCLQFATWLSQSLMTPHKNCFFTRLHNTIKLYTPHAGVDQNTMDLIADKGYNLEEHKIVTEDGYILSGWRIHKNITHPYPIILQHGLLDSSQSWFMNNTKKQCFPYILVEEGFDVWCMNNRGNKYSIGHVDYHHVDYNTNYWNYSFDDLVKFDVKALIHYTKQITQKEKVIYIGHSQGTSQMLAYLSTNIEFQKHLKCFIGLGPALYISHQKSKLIKFAIQSRVFELLEYIGIPYFFVFDDSLNHKIGALCDMMPIIFKNGLFWITQQLCGYPVKNKIDLKKFGLMVSHEPGGCSTRNIIQWMQFFRAKELQYYDYGVVANQRVYGQASPPKYPLENLKNLMIPKYLYLGTKDVVTDTEDLDKMLSLLDKTHLKVEFLNDYAHLDYVWAVDAYQILYPQLLRDIFENSKN